MANHIDLFNGRDLSNWHFESGEPAGWKIGNGYFTVTPGAGDIVSDETFGDAMIHLEWREPDMPEAHGQDKGNSGVYLHGCYELQVLDSFGIDVPDTDDCGAIYKMHAPAMNACKPAMEWQSYDILFRAPRFDEAGNKTEDARITVLQNGLPVQNNVVLPRVTPGGMRDYEAAEGPLLLQDHGDPVSFRNIRIIKL